MNTTKPLITANMVLRAEGMVWRYDYIDNGVKVRGDKEIGVYTYLRDVVGLTRDGALAVIRQAHTDWANSNPE